MTAPRCDACGRYAKEWTIFPVSPPTPWHAMQGEESELLCRECVARGAIGSDKVVES